MKKLITAAALFAAGTALASAATTTLETNLSEGATSTTGGNYYGVVFSLSSDWLSNSLSSTEYVSFSLESVTIEGRATWSSATTTSANKLAIHDAGGKYYAVSSALSTEGNFATFSFDTPLSLDIDTVYYAAFVTSGVRLSGTGITGGSFSQQNVKSYSNSSIGTSDTTTGGFISSGGGNSIADNTYKANITIVGTAVAIPEPSAFGLLAGAGALALVAARRRRSRKA